MKYQVMDAEGIDGAYAYYFEYDADGTKTKQEGYNGCDYSNPKDPSIAAAKKLWAYIYDGDTGDLTEKYTYYFASQFMESRTILDAGGDADGNVYYHYLDEDWALSGLRQVRQAGVRGSRRRRRDSLHIRILRRHR